MVKRQIRKQFSKQETKKRLKFLFCTSFAIIITFVLPTLAFSAEDNQIPKNNILENKKTNIYSNIYYYEEDKLNRYIDYQNKNKILTAEDVVWMVNADLDNPFYTNPVTIDVNSIYPLVVNKYNKLPDDYIPRNLVEISPGQLATEQTKNAFEKMKKDAYKEGCIINVLSAYLSIGYQKTLYNSYLSNDTQEKIDTYFIRPGHNEHHTGRAIDITNSANSLDEFEKSKECEWVAKNAYKYGFIIRYQKDTSNITGNKYEPWHIRYVGTNIAKTMIDNNIKTLEEYKVKYIDHKQGTDIYSNIYYYEEDKLNRYIDYHTKNPHLSAEDVVWMVNTGLDNPFYTNIKTIENIDAFPLIVNKYNKLPDNYKAKNLKKLSSGLLATSETKDAYEKMRVDALNEGYKITAASAYRSITYQKNLYNRYLKKDSKKEVDTYSARSGHSEHHTGRAIDLIGSYGSLSAFEKCKESTWVAKNAHKYGFIIRYQKDTVHITGYKYEPWHITYVGTDIANTMHDIGIKSLEEYMVKYIYHKHP